MRTSIFLILLLFCNFVSASPIHVVAAENIYGSIAQQIGGEYVQVYSILNNPKQDPHLFSASHETAIALANADIVIVNGAGYDAWQERLLFDDTKKSVKTLVVAKLIHKERTSNPHFWYDPKTIPIVAKALTESFIKLDSDHRAYYDAQLKKFNRDYQVLIDTIQKLKARYANTPIIATEPIFNDMADALGLKMYGHDFQINIMNDVEPTPTQIRSFEDKLRQHQVKLLIYNHQVGNPRTQRMQEIAQQEHIPTIGMNEMLPPKKTYVEWMLDELRQLEQKLSARH